VRFDNIVNALEGLEHLLRHGLEVP
jgi:hypothetical protein